MASAPQDLSEVYLLEKRKGEIEEVQSFSQQERNELVDTVRELTKELRLKVRRIHSDAVHTLQTSRNARNTPHISQNERIRHFWTLRDVF